MKRRNERGFAIVDAGAAVGVLALLCALGMVAAGQGRRSAGLAGSLANLKKIGEAGACYAADFDDQLWAFTWSRDEHPTRYPDLMNPPDHANAVTYQAVDIVRRLSGDESLPRMDNIFRPPFLSTLVLADYIGESLPAEWMVSPGDTVRLYAQQHPDDPPDFSGGGQGGDAWNRLFGTYGSSYGLMPAFFAPDEKVGSQSTLYQYPAKHDLFQVPGLITFGKRRIEEVVHPSAKVHVAERESFFFGPRPAYYLHPSARVPLLMADGSAAPRTAADANQSFSPNLPDDPSRATVLDYVPNLVYEAPALSGGAKDEDLDGSYKWTRRGLRGVDFSGERAE